MATPFPESQVGCAVRQHSFVGMPSWYSINCLPTPRSFSLSRFCSLRCVRLCYLLLEVACACDRRLSLRRSACCHSLRQAPNSREVAVQPALHIQLQQLLAPSTGIQQVCIVANPAQLPLLLPYLDSLRRNAKGSLCCELPVSEHEPSHAVDPTLRSRIRIVIQHQPLGFGDAVLRAETFVGDEPFLVALGDHVFTPGCIEDVFNAHANLITTSSLGPEVASKTIALTGACLCSEFEVPQTGLLRLSQPGAEENKGARLTHGQGVPIEVVDMAEKPQDLAPFELQGEDKGRYLSQLGLDVLPRSIFDELRAEQHRLAAQKDGTPTELDLRKVMRSMQRERKLFACRVQGTRLDIGNPEAYWKSLQAAYQPSLSETSISTPALHRITSANDEHVDGVHDGMLEWLRRHYPDVADDLESNSGSISLASAPGRVDVMGGFADYSGSDVLQYPTAARTYAMIVQTNQPTLTLTSLHVSSFETEVLKGGGPAHAIWSCSLPTQIMFADPGCTTTVDQGELKAKLASMNTGVSPRVTTSAQPAGWSSYVVGCVHAILRKRLEQMALSGENPPSFSERGFTVVLVSSVPPNVGIASSAAVEVSVALATSHCLGVSIEATELALICQSVENRVVGAACGMMDQLTAAVASSDALMALRCQLPLAHPPTRNLVLPPGFQIFALQTSVERNISAPPYERVRTAAMMGRVMMQSQRSDVLQRYLCEVSLADFNQHYRVRLPVSMTGQEFLSQYGEALKRHATPEDCTTVHPHWDYPIQAATAHPIEEQARVAAFTVALESFHSWPSLSTKSAEEVEQQRLRMLGELMAQSHVAYDLVGLGSNETNLLTSLIRSHSISKVPRSPLIGAKLTGGGSGGTIAVLARGSVERVQQALPAVTKQYLTQTGRTCTILSGSSGHMRVHGVRSFSTSHLNTNVSQDNAPRSPGLRVLLVNHGYPPQFNGGSEVYTQMLGIGLLRSGSCTQVDVFAREHDAFRSDFSMRQAQDSLDSRLTLHLINHAREAPYNRFSSAPIDEQFRKLLERLTPDIVHFGHLNHLSFELPAVARQTLPHVRCVYTLHDFWLACPRGQFIEAGVTTPDGEPMRQCDGQSNEKCATRCYVGRFGTGVEDSEDARQEQAYWTSWIGTRMKAARSARDHIDAWIAPSVQLARRMHKEFDIPETKTLLLPYGFDRQRLENRKRTLDSSQPIVFGYIGRHQASKGLHLLIQAAAQIVDRYPQLASRFRVIIFGRSDASTQGALLRMVRDSILGKLTEPLVEWRPEYGNPSIVKSVLNHVDCIVVPSVWDENSPLVIHEAQQAKVPVITSEHGGMGELVQNGVNGLTFKHRSASSLADAMLEALHQPAGLRSLGERGYLHSADGQVPSLETHLETVLELYRRLIQQQPIHSASDPDCTEYAGLLQLARGQTSKTSYALPTTVSGPRPEPIVPLAAPWRVTFDTNPDDCNFSCTMCEQHSEHSPHQKARKASGIRRRRMDFSVIRSTFEKLAPRGLREAIPTTMGEPLMYKHFPQFLDLCREFNVKCNLTTNGSFYGRGVDAWARMIVPVTSDVKISWNGASETTQHRIMKGSNWRQQLANLRTFIHIRDELASAAPDANYCSVTLQLTFMEVNLDEIPAIVQLAIQEGVDRVKGHHLWAHFREIKDEDLRRSPESIARWNAVAQRCREIAASTPRSNGRPIRLDNFFDLEVSAAAKPIPQQENAVPAAKATASPIHPEAVCPFLGKEAWVNHAGRVSALSQQMYENGHVNMALTDGVVLSMATFSQFDPSVNVQVCVS